MAYAYAATTNIPRLAVNQVTTIRWSLEQIVVACQEVGIDNIGLWRQKVEDFGEERAVDFLQESGLNVSSLSWAGGFTGSHGLGYDEAIADASEAIELAGAMKAECLLVAAGGRAGHIRSHCCRLLIDALRRLGDEAGEHGVTLALQPMTAGSRAGWSFLRSIDATVDLLAECDHPCVGMGFHAGQLRHERDLVSRIRGFARHVALVQICDWQADTRDGMCLPGTGVAPLKGIVAAFQESDFSGCFEIDLWSEAAWQADYLQLLIDARTGFRNLVPAALPLIAAR